MASVKINDKSLSETVSKRIVEAQKNGDKSPHYASVFTYPSGLAPEATPLRSYGTIDTERIMNVPFYNRYQDKTQVYSLYKNDDISRRALHVQLVSRIARDIGSALCLNNDLIEAIALGHDLGHTPFGHLGEAILDRIYYEHAGLHFMHNVQSVRVLTVLFPIGISLETLAGILCHNGELEVKGITPTRDKNKNGIDSFDTLKEVLDKAVEEGPEYVRKLVPSTEEGAVVRFSDMFAYLGKDRYDAYKINAPRLNPEELSLTTNAKIIKYFTEDMVEKSFWQPYIALSDEAFVTLKALKRQNYEGIYELSDIKEQLGTKEGGRLYNAFLHLYEMFLYDLKTENTLSPIYTQHIDYLVGLQKPSRKQDYLRSYLKNRSERVLNTIVVDYLQSMTDTYFTSLLSVLSPTDRLEYIGYFGENNSSLQNYLRSKENEHC